MKRQVLLGLTVMLVCFFIGGFYVVFAIGEATKHLEHAVTLHSIADFHENLLENIRTLQTDLVLLKTGHSRSKAETVSHINTLMDSLSRSGDHQHYPELDKQLEDVHQKIVDYGQRVSSFVETADGQDDFEPVRADLLVRGDRLLREIDGLANKGLEGHAGMIYRGLSRINEFVAFMVVIGPLAIWLLTAFFLQKFTGSMQVLVEAAKVLKSGNLDFQVDGRLKYEFKELADSFDSMSSKLKEERDELQRVRLLYQTLFESAGEGILIMDLAPGRIGRIIAANAAAAAMHGYSVTEILQMNIASFNCEEGCDSRLAHVFNGQWSEYEIERLRKDGSTFLAVVSIGLLDLGEKQYALAFTRDITRQRQEELELQRANQLALVGEMAAGLAHEIKNPLAGIKVSLEVLADELTLTPDDQDLFDRLINETHRVEKLLKGLLSYARPPKLQLEVFNLNQLLDNSIKNVSIPGRNAIGGRIEIERSYADKLPPIQADTAQLQQVLLNVLLNAIEGMEGGGKLFVRTRYFATDSVKISIADTGKGLAVDNPTDIFQPFYTTKSKGTGLGLAICKRIIEEHGGSITASGNRYGGATFHIVLPLVHKRQDVYDDKKRANSAA